MEPDERFLRTIHACFEKSSETKVLDLSGFGDISEFFAEIRNLTFLQELYLKNNQIRHLPPEICNLINLKKLSLIRNELTELPAQIGELAKLRELFVSRNRLLFLPSTIGNLKNLRTLSLSSNELTFLPPEIGKLSRLSSLLLSKNKLEILPVEICNLSHLSSLLIGRNKLKTLPDEITRLTSLRVLELNGNLFETPLREVAQNGVYAIMSYLIGMRYGSGFDNVNKHRISVRRELQTALHQYLVYFTDFVHYAKGMNIDFNVITTEEGLELQLKAQDNEQIQTIGKFFKEYVELICQRVEHLNVKVESQMSDTERKILMVELRSQVRNLQSAVEIRNIRLEYLQSEVNFLRRLLTSKATHPQPIRIDVSSISASRSISEAKIDVKIEINDLQESFRELVAAMVKFEPSLDKEIMALSDSLGEIDDDFEDKDQINLPMIERVGNFLCSLADPHNKYAKILDRSKNGIHLLKKAGNAYNNIAEWLGLPQIPKVFI